MKKLTILTAFFIVAASTTMTSCVKDSESASVENIRSAKAEQLKALAAMQKAQGEAAVIMANAEKVIKEAEAKLREAEAAVKLAEAEHQKTMTEISKVALEEAKAKLEVAKQDALNQLANLIHKGEKDKIANQIEMNKLKIEMELALSNQSNFKLDFYYNIYANLLGNGWANIYDYNTGLVTQYRGLAQLSSIIVQNKKQLFDWEWNLTADGSFVQSQIEDKKRSIIANEVLIAKYQSQKELGYDGYLAEAKKFEDLKKAGDVALAGLNNESRKAQSALYAAGQYFGGNNEPNGAMYDSEFAVAARFLNSTPFPYSSAIPEEFSFKTYSFVPAVNYVQPKKTYEVFGHSVEYNEYWMLENYGAVDKANLAVQVDNYSVAYETYFTNRINLRQRNLNYWEPILEKSTKDYNDSLALRPKRLADKESTFDAFLSPFNKSVALAKEYPTKTPFHKNIGYVAHLTAGDDMNYILRALDEAITLVKAAIVEVTAYPESDNRTKELALLNGLNDQYGALVLPSKTYRTAFNNYNANTSMMDMLLNSYMKDNVDISISNTTNQVRYCKDDIASLNQELVLKDEKLAKIKAAQAVVNDPAKVAAYGDLFAKAKTALSAYSDAKIAILIQDATNSYNSSMAGFYLNLANEIKQGSTTEKNMIDQMIKECERLIARLNNEIAGLEKFGGDGTVNIKAQIEYYKAYVAELEAEYKRTEAMAAKYKALLDAEIAKGN